MNKIKLDWAKGCEGVKQVEGEVVEEDVRRAFMKR